MSEKNKETTGAVEQKRSLRQKLLAASIEIESVEKRGRNDFNKYDYATAADIIREARRVLLKHGIFVTSQESDILDGGATSNGTKITRVKMNFTLCDADSEECLSFFSTGDGMDSGDKGLYKAKTGAFKYFLQQNLMIPTGDDPEDDKDDHKVAAAPKAERKLKAVPTAPETPAPARATVEQVAQVVSVCQQKGIDPVAVLAAYNVDKLEDLDQGQFANFLARAAKAKPENRS